MKYLAAKMRTIYLMVVPLILAGCAYPVGNRGNAYVSPYTYMLYDCKMLKAEMISVGNQSIDLYKSLKKRTGSNSSILNSSKLDYWFTLFSLRGQGEQAKKYADLNNEYLSLVLAAKQKNCDMENLKVSPKEVIKQSVMVEQTGNSKDSSDQNLIRINRSIKYYYLPIETWRLNP